MLNRKGLSQLSFFMLPLLLVLCFSLGSSPAWALSTPQWIEFTPGMDQIPQTKVLESNFQQVILDVQIPGMWSEQVTTKGGDFYRLSIPECGVTNVIGEPNLPVLRKMVQIPYGAIVNVEVISSDFEERSLAELGISNRIIPVQPPIPKIEGAWENAPFVIHEEAYQSNSYYPAEAARVMETGELRGHRFATLEISPVSYNPVAGRVKLYSNLKIKVILRGADIVKTQNMLYRYASAPFEDLCNEMFVNYSAYQDMVKGAPALPIGYLIIVHDSFQAQATPLADWKTKKGYHVTVANTTTTGTTTASIKSYITQAYNNWPIPPTFVLFFGDVGFIPTYTGSFSGTATDLYYVQMNSDRFGDMFRARLPVRSTSDGTNIVNKLLYYDNPTSIDLEWMRHYLFIASSDHSSLTEGTHRYAILNFLVPTGCIIDSLWERLGGVTATAITNSINAGKTVVCYSGHGSTTSWATGSYGQSNINGLSNVNEYPLVLSHACLTGQFDLTECFGETWVKAANKGGIAFWGASNNSYWDEDDILERRMFLAAFQDTCYQVANMTDKALWYLYQYYGDVTNVKYYFDMYNVLGDPSTDVYTYIATDMAVTFPTPIPMLPSYAVPITVETPTKSPISGALICLKKGTEVFETAYTNSSGQATLYVSPATMGFIQLTVTAHNRLPFEDSIQVIPPGDAYLTFEGYRVDDDNVGASQGDGDGLVDFGETIELFVKVKNFGDSAAHNSYGILSSDKPTISIIGDSAYWGEVPSHDTATCQTPFVFSVSGDIPDQTVIPFHLDITATNGSWSFDEINITAHAPVLVYDHKQTFDVGGNGNNKPDPGETCDMKVTLRNDGSAGEVLISAQLIASDPYITVTAAGASYPDIPAGGTGTSITAYRFTISSSCPMGHHVLFALQISGAGSYSTVDTVDVLIGQTPILFVDDDGGGSYQSYFLPALDSTGFLYDVWTYATAGAPTDSVLGEYTVVVWSTGPDYGTTSVPKTLTATDQSRLMTYLNNGGNLFLSSQDLLLDNNPTTFIVDYLHVIGHTDDVSETAVAGVSGDTISDGMAFTLNPPFYNFSDYIVPGSGAAGIFTATVKGTTVPRAGVQLDEYLNAGKGMVDYGALRYPESGTSTYKVVFLAFPFEGVPQSGAEPDNSYTLMRRIIGWFGLGRSSSPYMHGDANGDLTIDIADVVWIINYLYKGGNPPIPLEMGDADCDGTVDVADVVYLINYLYKGGYPPPC
ncbi:MAG TPA: C25 family cysteine peptidase [candidate division Zixibacteria bacterium]